MFDLRWAIDSAGERDSAIDPNSMHFRRARRGYVAGSKQLADPPFCATVRKYKCSKYRCARTHAHAPTY